MRFSPSESEYAAIPGMSDQHLLEYFLLRVFETEEVWGLLNNGSWQMNEVEGQETVPLWPYQRFARDMALEVWQSSSPSSVSLEYFLEQILGSLTLLDVMLEIMPLQDSPGCLISPRQLQSIFEGMIDAGEYRLDS